jgi:hypothetical protein
MSIGNKYYYDEILFSVIQIPKKRNMFNSIYKADISLNTTKF